MYSDKKSILQLAALLKAHGVRKIVLCPGSRNAAIVHTLANIEDFTCYSITDERSAGFFAIGLSLQGGGPAAVCCTSGSALLNLHPALAEAFYQQIPLIVISADRPAAWIGQMDGQTDLYVNLRCMEILEGEAKLYAGGGILASSEMVSELEETKEKMKTMINIL